MRPDYDKSNLLRYYFIQMKLKENPTLKDLQEYIEILCKERGWDKNGHLEKFLLLIEEVGELAKATRIASGMYGEKAKAGQKRFELEEEFADVLNYLLDLANHFNVDLEHAFREKNEINETRKWEE